VNQDAVLDADRQFFDALLHADTKTLDRILADDFIIIDVMRGAETTKPALLGAIGSGQVRFEAIEPSGCRARVYRQAAVVTGRTLMRIRFDDTPFVISSQYTHVYIEMEGQWRLVTAQGTEIRS